jgi:hypothetical protein
MTDLRPGEPDGETRPPIPVWGAGNVVLRHTTTPIRFPRWRRFGRVLGAVTAVAGPLIAPFLLLGMMGFVMSWGDPNREPVYPSPTPAVTVTAVPAAFGGRWNGNAQHFLGGQAKESWTVEVDLDAGASTGRLVVRELACSAQLSDLGGTVDELQFSATDDEGAGRCLPPGGVTLTFRSAQRLDFGWTAWGGNWESQAYGSVSKP